MTVIDLSDNSTIHIALAGQLSIEEREEFLMEYARLKALEDAVTDLLHYYREQQKHAKPEYIFKILSRPVVQCFELLPDVVFYNEDIKENGNSTK